MAVIQLLALLSTLLALSRSEFPFDYNPELDVETYDSRNDDLLSYRLPEDLDPIHCDIEITPYFDEAPEGKEIFTFDGKATLLIKPLKTDHTSIIVQENVREILSVTVTDAETGVSLEDENNTFESIREHHFLRINLREGVTLEIGREYKIYVEYIGNINETPLSRGMFRGYYRDENNRIRWYAATHLQPTHSRQLFPSFDEPGFKSTFNIIVNRPMNFTQTFSNMPLLSEEVLEDRVREVFSTTPRMSAYLISIHISDGFMVIADNNNAQKSYRIIARPTAEKQGAYALEVGPPITKWLDNYFGINYYDMAVGIKNDQLASPFWASGATENWGLVTYREVRLLYEENETNAFDKMYIGTITAHELAHKWFGNYITCRWWDNVWINEGFASYFEYFAMHGVDEKLELEDQFNIMYLQSALSVDATPNTRALQHTVNSPAQVTGHFSGISYSKGASLLLMLKHMVTEETFKKALNLFLVDRAYEHALPEDLYRAFENATNQDGTLIDGVNMTDFMRDWVIQPGYPVLTVNVNMGTGLMSLTQKRFYINAETEQTDEIWPLPLTFTSGSNPNWDNLTVTRIMTEKTGEIQKSPGHEWVIFNVKQKGIYRVHYDNHNWEMIASTLNRDVNSVHYLNRAQCMMAAHIRATTSSYVISSGESHRIIVVELHLQIVDDVFAFMRSEIMTYNLGFQILEFLKKDTSYYSWYPATGGFNWIRNRFLHLPVVLDEFDKIIYEYLDAVIKHVGYDVVQNEPLTAILNRLFILSFACNIGHSGCIEDAVTKFRNYIDNGVPVDPNLRRHVFCTGLREGNYEDWRRIYERRSASNNQADEVAMLRALGCTPDKNAVRDFLAMVTTDEVKAQDRLNAITWLLAGDRKNADALLEFLRTGDNLQRIRTAVVLPASFNSVLSTLASYLDIDGLTEMENWLRMNQDTIPEYNVGLNAIDTARRNQQWGTDKAPAILEAVRGSASVLIPTITLLISTLIALMLK